MADLSEYIIDRKKQSDGEEVQVGPEGEKFFITTRGFTTDYKRYLEKLLLREVRELNKTADPGDILVTPDTLPSDLRDLCTGTALAEHCFISSRELTCNGKPVTADAFKNLLREGQPAIIRYAFAAASSVGWKRDEEVRDAVKNSPAPSTGH